MRRTILIVGASGSLLLFPVSASAHLVNTRCGPFYNGLCHPFVTPTDLMIILTLSLLAGLAGPSSGRGTLFSLTFSWMAGAIIAATWHDSSFTMPVAGAAVMTLILGLLVAARCQCSGILLGLLGAVVGLGFGLSNGTEFGALKDGPLTLAGNVSCVFGITAWVTALVVKNNHGWRQIVVRVAGSWIAAANLLLLGWVLRGKI